MFAELSCVAGQAETGEEVDSIQTGGSIQTRVRLALINICRHTTQTCIIPHLPSVSMGSIWLVICYLARMLVCIHVYLFHSAGQCIQVRTHIYFALLFCSKSLRSDTHFLSMAADLNRRHNANGKPFITRVNGTIKNKKCGSWSRMLQYVKRTHLYTGASKNILISRKSLFSSVRLTAHGNQKTFRIKIYYNTEMSA